MKAFQKQARFVVLAVLLFSAAVLAAHAGAQTSIMPMGDSLTVGVDYYTNTVGGYRAGLYEALTEANVSFTFVGANNNSATSALNSAGDEYHNGFGGWRIEDLNANLDGVAAPIGGGDSNLGGYLITGGHGTGRSAMLPNLLLLQIGTNNLLQGDTSITQHLQTLVTHFHALSPNTIIFVAAIPPINSTGFTAVEQSYNTYIQNTLVPSLSYTRYVDQNSSFLNADGSVQSALIGTDKVHPDKYGYPILADVWNVAIEKYLAGGPVTTTPTPPPTPAGGASVSVQFVGGGAAPLQLNTANYTAGANQVSFWNPVLVSGNTTTPQSLSLGSLQDSTGATSQIGFSLQASGAYYTGAGSGFTTSPSYPGYPGQLTGPGDKFLFEGFAYAGYSDKNPITLSVTGLKSGEKYSLYVYVSPFEGFGNSQDASVSLTGGTTYYIATNGSLGSYQRAASTTSGSPASGNYVEFDGLTGSSSQTITLTSAGTMVGVSGFQLVDMGAN